MADKNSPNSNGLSSRSQPKLAFVPLLEGVDKLNATAANVEIDMGMGENWLTRDSLVAIFKKAVAEQFEEKDLSYTLGMGGSTQVLSAFASFFNQYFNPGIPILPSHIIVGAGASTCLESLLYAICEAGDSVLVPSPFWGGAAAFAKLRDDVNFLPAPAPSFRTATASDIIAAVKKAYDNAPDPSRIKALSITNPHNPLSRCYSPSVLRDLMCCKVPVESAFYRIDV